MAINTNKGKKFGADPVYPLGVVRQFLKKSTSA